MFVSPFTCVSVSLFLYFSLTLSLFLCVSISVFFVMSVCLEMHKCSLLLSSQRKQKANGKHIAQPGCFYHTFVQIKQCIHSVIGGEGGGRGVGGCLAQLSVRGCAVNLQAEETHRSVSRHGGNSVMTRTCQRRQI